MTHEQGATGPSARTRRALPRVLTNAGNGLDARNVVGLAHIVLGAIGLSSGLFGVVFAANDGETVRLIVHAAALGTGLLIILAGLWLREGRRRGAVLAAVLDSARLILLLWATRNFTLDVILAGAFLASVIWLWPTLSHEEVEAPSRPI